MRIGISALYRSNGGSLTNLVQLLEQWALAGELDKNAIVILASPWTASGIETSLNPETIQKIELIRIPGADRGLFSRLWAEQIKLPRQAKKMGLDVIFCPANVVPFMSPVPTVVTFQNAAPYCETVTPKTVGWKLWLRFRLLRTFISMSARRAKKIIFISEYFRRICEEKYSLPRARSTVIYRSGESVGRGMDLSRAASDGLPDGPFILTIGHIWPYKNIVELVRGFGLARQAGPHRNHRLVIAGKHFVSGYQERTEAALREIGDSAQLVTFLGHVPHRGCMELLKNAAVFVFPSTCENCPTALVEALAYGVPVAASDIGVMPEIAGEAAVYFDPFSPESIAHALGQLMDDRDLRSVLSGRARERAAEFPDPAVCAQRTLEVLREAAIRVGV